MSSPTSSGGKRGTYFGNLPNPLAKKLKTDSNSDDERSARDRCRMISDDDAEEIIDAIVDPQHILTEEDWEKVMYLAIHRPTDFGSSAKPTWYLRRYDENKIGPDFWYGTLFHFVVVQNPPLDVVKQILTSENAGTYPQKYLTKRVDTAHRLDVFRFPFRNGDTTYVNPHIQSPDRRNVVSTIAEVSMSSCPLALAIWTGASLDVVKYLADVTGKIDVDKMGQQLLSSVRSLSLPTLKAILERHPDCVRARVKDSLREEQSFLTYSAWRRNRNAVDEDKLDLILMATAAGTIDASQAKKKNYLRPHSFIFHLLDIRRGALNDYETTEFCYHLDRYANICPEEFKLRDNAGDLPLHILIANSHGFPRVSRQTQAFRLLLEKIIALCPDAATVRNKADQTPLDLAAALASPFYDTVLAHSSTDVVNAPCPSTNLLPFQSAACGYISEKLTPKTKEKIISSSPKDQLLRTEIGFELLRKAPNAVDPRRLGFDTSYLDNKLVREVHFDELKLKQYAVKLQRKKQRLEKLNKLGDGEGPGIS